jgi:hypothetical protein
MEIKPLEELLSENEEALKPVDKAIEGLVHMGEQEDLLEVTEKAVWDLHSRYVKRRELHEALAQRAMDTKDVIEALPGGRLS